MNLLLLYKGISDFLSHHHDSEKTELSYKLLRWNLKKQKRTV